MCVPPLRYQCAKSCCCSRLRGAVSPAASCGGGGGEARSRSALSAQKSACGGCSSRASSARQSSPQKKGCVRRLCPPSRLTSPSRLAGSCCSSESIRWTCHQSARREETPLAARGGQRTGPARCVRRACAAVVLHVGDGESVLHDVREGLLRAAVGVGERRRGREALAEEDAERPQVRGGAVPERAHDLGRHELGRAAQREEGPVLGGAGGGEAKVGDDRPALAREEHVLRLEVAVHDGLLVHVGERAHELPGHEADLLLPHRLALVLLEVARERVVGHVLLHHVQELRRLEGVVDRNHVRVVARLEALELARGVQLPTAGAGGEDLLVEHLEGVHDAAVLLARVQHLALVPLAQDLQQLEVRHAGDVLLLGLEVEQRLEGRRLHEAAVRVCLQLGEHLGDGGPEEVARRQSVRRDERADVSGSGLGHAQRCRALRGRKVLRVHVPRRAAERVVGGSGEELLDVGEEVKHRLVGHPRRGQPAREEGEEDGVGEHLLERDLARSRSVVLAHHRSQLPHARAQVAPQVLVEDRLLVERQRSEARLHGRRADLPHLALHLCDDGGARLAPAQEGHLPEHGPLVQREDLCRLREAGDRIQPRHLHRHAPARQVEEGGRLRPLGDDHVARPVPLQCRSAHHLGEGEAAERVCSQRGARRGALRPRRAGREGRRLLEEDSGALLAQRLRRLGVRVLLEARRRDGCGRLPRLLGHKLVSAAVDGVEGIVDGGGIEEVGAVGDREHQLDAAVLPLEGEGLAQHL
mmetsp:Transcript_31825/g.99855  ORF Transcript_31825/g.99855 Transcript_31825/m.99855 type:complete len:756 (-) Transcript_31825:778-3045(-)